MIHFKPVIRISDMQKNQNSKGTGISTEVVKSPKNKKNKIQVLEYSNSIEDMEKRYKHYY
jgi:hypothetical protein